MVHLKCGCGFEFNSKRDRLEIMLDIGRDRGPITAKVHGLEMTMCYICYDEYNAYGYLT